MTQNSHLLGIGRKVARFAASLAVAIAMLAAISVAPAAAQCRGRDGRARRVFTQNYNGYPGAYQARRILTRPQVTNYPGYNNAYYPGYSNYPGYYDPNYDPYNHGPGKGKDVLAVGASVGGGALLGGMIGGTKGALIGAAAGAALGAGIVVKRHHNYNNQYRFPY